MSEVRLEVKNLCKSFGITKAVQNVSFNVNKGEVHALIGENGSGKSTLTNMLTGIYSIGSGTFVLPNKLWPFDSDFRIIPCHAAFITWMIEIRTFIAELCEIR